MAKSKEKNGKKFKLTSPMQEFLQTAKKLDDPETKQQEQDFNREVQEPLLMGGVRSEPKNH